MEAEMSLECFRICFDFKSKHLIAFRCGKQLILQSLPTGPTVVELKDAGFMSFGFDYKHCEIICLRLSSYNNLATLCFCEACHVYACVC